MQMVAATCRDGRDCSGAHADRLTLLGVRPIIASLSLGATRLFRIRRAVAAADNGTAAATLSPESTQRASMATGDLAVASVVGDAAAGGGAAPGKRRKVIPPAVDITLEHNSLLIMMPPAQEAYKHEVHSSWLQPYKWNELCSSGSLWRGMYVEWMSRYR